VEVEGPPSIFFTALAFLSILGQAKMGTPTKGQKYVSSVLRAIQPD
jgi:hypothetical protein